MGSNSEARPIVDSAGRIFAIAAGKPSDPTYTTAAKEAFKAIWTAGAGIKFNAKAKTHRRGGFAALNIGTSYGKGQQEPRFLETKPYTAMLEGLLKNSAIQRLASYASGAALSLY
jgi:hypothetical protein